MNGPQNPNVPQPAVPASRTPGVPPMGGRRDGPLGPRMVSPDKAEQLASIVKASQAEAQQQAQETEQPPPELTPNKAPAEDKKKDDKPLSVFDELERMARDGEIRDLLFHQRLAWQDCAERRELIEAHVEPADAATLLNEAMVRGEFRQKVWPWGEKGSSPMIEFRSHSGREEFLIQEYLNGRYARIASVAQPILIVGMDLVRVADVELPPMPAKVEKDEDRIAAFARRLELIIDRPYTMLWDLYLNQVWFNSRVKRSMTGEPFRAVAQKS